MTEEQTEALRVFQRQVGTFHTPPGCDDGVVARSFASNDDYIYEFALRNADKVVTLTAFRHLVALPTVRTPIGRRIEAAASARFPDAAVSASSTVIVAADGRRPT